MQQYEIMSHKNFIDRIWRDTYICENIQLNILCQKIKNTYTYTWIKIYNNKYITKQYKIALFQSNWFYFWFF